MGRKLGSNHMGAGNQTPNFRSMRSLSCPTLCYPIGCSPPGLLCPWDSPGKNTGVGCHALLQGIFPTQGSNPHLLCLLRCRRVLSPLNHRGSPAAEKQVTVEGRSLTSSWPENHGRKPAGNSRPARAPWGRVEGHRLRLAQAALPLLPGR